MSESVELVDGNLPIAPLMANLPKGIKTPTPEEDDREAQLLCLKLMLSPQSFTLLDLSRLQELMISLGYMD